MSNLLTNLVRTPVRPSHLVLVFFSLFYWATYPGWMSGDSYTYWVEASGQFLISDWHSPVLSYFWSNLGALSWGPLIPFTLQVVCTSFGTNRIFSLMEKRSIFSAWVGFLVLVACPLIWTTAWIWTDIYISSCLLAAVGFYIVSHESTKFRIKKVSHLAAVATLALGSLGRPYMFLSILAFAWFLQSLNSRQVTRLKFVVPFLVVFSLAFVFQQIKLDYWHSGTQGSTLLWDLAGIECRTRITQPSTPTMGLVPREFIENQDVNDFCDSYSPITFDSLFWLADKNKSYFRLPANRKEMNKLINIWVEASLNNSFLFLEKKTVFLSKLLLKPIDKESFPLNGIDISRDGEIGLGPQYLNNPYKKMFLSRSSPAMSLLSWPARWMNELLNPLTNVISQWTIIGFVAWIFLRKRRALNLTLFLISQIPGILWVLGFSFIAPALGYRYLIPALIMNLAGFILTISLGEQIVHSEKSPR